MTIAYWDHMTMAYWDYVTIIYRNLMIMALQLTFFLDMSFIKYVVIFIGSLIKNFLT